MSQLILMIAKIDEVDNPETLTELWRQSMPIVNLSDIRQVHYLNELESQVSETGWEAMRQLMVEQWRLTDGLLVEEFRQEQAGGVVGDGHDLLKVVSRMGVVHLPRQVCYLPGSERHTLPGNAGLAEHEGQVTTRGLQEWVCLLPHELPFGTTARLLGWMAHEPEVVSETQVRRWVCRHGEWIRQAEQAEVEKQERRAHRQYIGSAHVEKGNHLRVARRQKHQDMHWSEQTSDAQWRLGFARSVAETASLTSGYSGDSLTIPSL